MSRVTFDFARMTFIFFDDRFVVAVDRLCGTATTLSLDELEQALLEAREIKEQLDG